MPMIFGVIPWLKRLKLSCVHCEDDATSCCAGTMAEKGLSREPCSRNLTKGRALSMLRRYVCSRDYNSLHNL